MGHEKEDKFRKIAYATACAVGSPWAFLVAVIVIAVWGTTGPLFHFSDTWQLVINTGTTIVTFLMVFLIQASQNRDSRAVQLKLDELIRSQKTARNIFADIEDASEAELNEFHREFKELRRKGLPPDVAAEKAAAVLQDDDDGDDDDNDDDAKDDTKDDAKDDTKKKDKAESPGPSSDERRVQAGR